MAQNNSDTNNRETSYSCVEDLHLDRVVASNPEIGPTPPDGGYGWMIVLGAVIYSISVPTLLVAYGVVTLFIGVESEDYDDDQVFKIWDENTALVPVFYVVMQLLLESWCRAIVKVFNMPRFIALSGICTTVAGILLSSFGTNPDDNEYIVNIFAGIFIGIGAALTGQQTEIILKHYFRDRLEMVQTIVRISPAIGNCIVPYIITILCSKYSNDTALLIYGAIVLQNCIFLASYSRPIYIVKLVRKTYNMIRDIDDDEDQEIFSKAKHQKKKNVSVINTGETSMHDNEQVADTFNQNSPIETLSPSVQMRDVNRFSSDFSNMDIGTIERNSIDVRIPEPLYRETTIVNEERNNYSFVFDQNPTSGTIRRTASVKRNCISIMSMFSDAQFYLYTLLHFSTVYSILILGIFLPSFISQQENTLKAEQVSQMLCVINVAAFCFVLLCTVLPKSLNKKARLCSAFCTIGAIGFYGVATSTGKAFMIIWGTFATFAVQSCNLLKQPIYDDMMNDFDATATSTASNTITAFFIILWSVIYNYQYKTCFETAAFLHTLSAAIFLLSSLKWRRQ